MKPFNKYFDHTLLKADALSTDIIRICSEAKEYNFAAVCVNGCHVPLVSSQLEDSDVKTACVVGFPLGAASEKVKAYEAKKAIEDGADEIDTVINIGFVKEDKFDLIESELKLIADLCHKNEAILKVILETSLLTDSEIIKSCRAAEAAEVDFIKTSTGFSTGGATIHAVSLIKRTIAKNTKIKASGGIRSLKDAELFINSGADRLGCSASVSIMEEYISKHSANK